MKTMEIDLDEWLSQDHLLWVVGPAVAVLVLALIIDWIAKKKALPLAKKLILRTETKIDDIIINKVVTTRLIHVLPFIVLYTFSPVFKELDEFILRASSVLISIIILSALGALIDSVNEIYHRSKMANKVPIKSHLQLVKIFVYVVGAVTILSQITGQSPWYFITGVSVFTAIVLMIFKETILSFVASLQIASNDLFREGDWLEMPKYGADGDVTDISLHAVRVQNWDKTITVIPTFKFLEESFKNWRGMTETGGRRIKRSITIDMSSIRFVDEEMLQKFKKIEYIKDYIAAKEKEIANYNREHGLEGDIISGRAMTNIGSFRAYLNEYLHHNTNIHPGLTFLIRQLEPGPGGLPIQVYVFTNDTAWVNYEGIQSDIFDHLLAVVPRFDLKIFQNPTGQDFKEMGSSGPRSLEG